MSQEYIPARKIKSSPVKNIGYVASRKMNRMVKHESLLERDAIYLFEFDCRVLSYFEQPIAIPYKIKGRNHTYYPDFICKLCAGETELLEIKISSELEDPDIKIKIHILEEFCNHKRWKHRVLTEKDIRIGSRIENIQFLSYCREQTSATVQYTEKILDLFCGEKQLTISEVLDCFQNDDKYNVAETIYFLLYHQKLYTDIQKRLSLDSVLIRNIMEDTYGNYRSQTGYEI